MGKRGIFSFLCLGDGSAERAAAVSLLRRAVTEKSKGWKESPKQKWAVYSEKSNTFEKEQWLKNTINHFQRKIGRKNFPLVLFSVTHMCPVLNPPLKSHGVCVCVCPCCLAVSIRLSLVRSPRPPFLRLGPTKL